MIFILAFSGSVGIKLTYSAGISIGIQNSSCFPFPHGVCSVEKLSTCRTCGRRWSAPRAALSRDTIRERPRGRRGWPTGRASTSRSSGRARFTNHWYTVVKSGFQINRIAYSKLNWIINSLIALFRECIIALNETFRKAETLPQQAIREKYKAEK